MADDGGNNGGESRRVVVAGYGPVGRTTCERLEACGVEVTVIELNLDTVERQLQLNRRIVYGDVTDREVLCRAGVPFADALILTIPDEEAAIRACRAARELSPNLFITARTNFVSRGLLASQAGADQVIVEEIVTAEAMQRAVTDRFGELDESGAAAR